MAAPRVTFIGLGNMGGPMAHNIIASGFRTVVVDLDPNKSAPLVEVGGRLGSQPEVAVADADVVFTSLPGPAQIKQLGAAILPAMRPGSVWIDLSTNNLACGKKMASLAAEHGVDFLDAPVSGGVEGAAAGTLTIMIGGNAAVVARCRTVLKPLGSRIEHVGPSGAGYVAKISQVMLCYLNSVCLTEALVLGAKGGVDPAKMLDIIRTSTGRSYVADQYGPEILNGDYDDTFDLGLAAKDLRLALELGGDVGASLEFTQLVSDLYARAEESFGFSAPHLIAMQLIERQNGVLLSQNEREPGTHGSAHPL